MMPVRIELDFAKRRRRVPIVGFLVLALGAGAVYATVADYRNASIESQVVAMNLARYDRSDSSNRAAESDANPALVTAATEELSTPWSRLFNDLEVAAAEEKEDVALLEIAPDRNKQSVRISGEARTLSAALDYMRRLQAASSIAYPLLENHEMRSAERERPVHFVIVADWRIQS